MQLAADSPRIKRDWGRAAKAFGAVLADTSRSDKVAELAVALEGDTMEKYFLRFRAHPEGQKLLREKPSLFDALKDKDKMLSLPRNTLGHAYGKYMQQERLDAAFFSDITDNFVDEKGIYDEDRRYFRRRMRDSHDVWHALTGYGADQLGEAAVLAFTIGQNFIPGAAVLAGFAFLFAPIAFPNDRLGWQPYLIQAYQRGRNAKWLPVARIEELLEKPVSEVQRMFNVTPTPEAHPGGVYAYNFGDRRVRRVKD
ncbi:MAG: Coq4 family protein [Bdellovibrionota bacterium]